MREGLRLTGKIVSGAKQAALFTQLDWVQKQCMEKLGFRPYPGTLNVEISPGSVKALEALEKENGIGLISPDPTFCNAKAFPVSMGGVTGAIVIPEEKVRVHGKSIVEVMAHLRLKDALGAEDGDFVTLVVENPKSQKRED